MIDRGLILLSCSVLGSLRKCSVAALQDEGMLVQCTPDTCFCPSTVSAVSRPPFPASVTACLEQQPCALSLCGEPELGTCWSGMMEECRGV